MSIPIFWSVVAHEIDRISKIETQEFVQIVGHFHKITSGEKTQELDIRGYTPAQLAAVKARIKERFVPIQSLGLRFSSPLDEISYPLMDYILVLFSQYDQHGTLPFPGSLSDQPAKVIEIFNVLQSLKLEQETKARKAAEAQAKRNRR